MPGKVFTKDEVFDFIRDEDVSFIRLAFCDIRGRQKNISIMPAELERAFSDGISFDASAIYGFGSVVNSDLLLFPIPSTLNILPWRPSHGKVIRMFCEIKHPDGTPFEKDSRLILKRAIEAAKNIGISVQIGSEFEFYLFKTDDNGRPTKAPLDRAGYMDVAPDDKGENVRREICLNMLDMGMLPESSHHEEGPGQNEIDFRYGDAMQSADNALNFIALVKAIAERNGLYADFSPKPLESECGSGLHINISVKSENGADVMSAFMAGIIEHIKELTFFLNPDEQSYKRLGEKKAPKYISWSPENRSQLIRIPAAKGEYKRIELRSPDPLANPYIAYAGLIYAGLDGISRGLTPPVPINTDLYAADEKLCAGLEKLPGSLSEAWEIAKSSAWIESVLPGFLS